VDEFRLDSTSLRGDKEISTLERADLEDLRGQQVWDTLATWRASLMASGRRPSLEERYRDKADYVAKVRAAAGDLVRYLLTEDVEL
jgi:hypothetical protein